jgi:hypothetical protein
VKQYDAMVGPENFIVIDGTADIEEQQKVMRQKATELLPRQFFRGKQQQEVPAE